MAYANYGMNLDTAANMYPEASYNAVSFLIGINFSKLVKGGVELSPLRPTIGLGQLWQGFGYSGKYVS